MKLAVVKGGIARSWDYLVLAACAAMVARAAYLSGGSMDDDAMITLTYAKNIAQGHGPIYNAGAPSFGTTSPLHMYLLGALGWVFGPAKLPQIATIVTALYLGASALLFRAAHRRFSLPPTVATCIGVLWLGIPYYYQGGESSLFALLMLIALLCWGANRPLLFGVAVGLLFLVRGEGALFGIVWGAERLLLWLRQRGDWRAALLRPGLLATAGLLAVLVPWWGHAYLTFGALLPDTFHMKLGAAGPNAATAFHTSLIQRSIWIWGFALLGPFRLALWFAAIPGLIIALYKYVFFRRYFAWIALYTLCYAAMDVVDSQWYHVPLELGWLACVGVAIGQVLGGTADYGQLGVPRHLARIFAMALLSLLSLRYDMRDAPNARDPRGGAYGQIAQWIRENTLPTATLASREVGHLGFNVPNPIVDLDGLTSPWTAPLALANQRAQIFENAECDLYVFATVRENGHFPPAITIGPTTFVRLNSYNGERGWPLMYALYVNVKSQHLNPGVQPPALPVGTTPVPIGSGQI